MPTTARAEAPSRCEVTLGRPDRPQCSTSMRDDDDDDGDDDGRAGAADARRRRGAMGRAGVVARAGARVVARAKEASGSRRLARGRARLERRESRGAGWVVAVGGVPESFNLKDGRRAFVKTSAKDPSMFAGRRRAARRAPRSARALSLCRRWPARECRRRESEAVSFIASDGIFKFRRARRSG